MTKQEAENKWCPLSMSILGYQKTITGNKIGTIGVGNRADNGGWIGACIAYHCMLWRTYDKAVQYEGYCGLGGKP